MQRYDALHLNVFLGLRTTTTAVIYPQNWFLFTKLNEQSNICSKSARSAKFPDAMRILPSLFISYHILLSCLPTAFVYIAYNVFILHWNKRVKYYFLNLNDNLPKLNVRNGSDSVMLYVFPQRTNRYLVRKPKKKAYFNFYTF